MFGNKDVNTYLSTFLDDESLVNLTKVDKNFKSDDIWRNKLREVELCTDAFMFVDGFINVDYSETSSKTTLLEPFRNLQKELKDKVNKFEISDYESTYTNILEFNKNLLLMYHNDFSRITPYDIAQKILFAIKNANDYEKFYYTKVFFPILEDEVRKNKERHFFCSTGMSDESRERMHKRKLFRNLFNAILIELLNLSLDHKYDLSDLIVSAKVLFENYKLEYNFEQMVEILANGKNYEIW